MRNAQNLRTSKRGHCIWRDNAVSNDMTGSELLKNFPGY